VLTLLDTVCARRQPCTSVQSRLCSGDVQLASGTVGYLPSSYDASSQSLYMTGASLH
jgi:hypothetical protein